jgi:hypothetical protein
MGVANDRAHLDVLSREIAPHVTPSFRDIFFRNVDVEVFKKTHQAPTGSLMLVLIRKSFDHLLDLALLLRGQRLNLFDN